MLINLNSRQGKKKIQTVPSQRGLLTYNGSAQTPVWDNFDPEQLSISGMTSAVDSGTYAVAFTPTSRYKWADGSTSAKTVIWTIKKAAGSLALSAASGKVSGKNKTITFEVTRAGDGAISVKSSNTAIATATVSGTTVTVTSRGYGTATITVSVAEGTNHNAPSSKTYSVTVDYIYLYNAGDKCTSVTGGWKTRAWIWDAVETQGEWAVAPVATDNSTYIHLKQTTKSTTNRYTGVWETVNNINLQGVDQISITVNSAELSGSSFAYFGVMNRSVSSSKSAFHASALISANSSCKTYTIDVSSLTGSYDIGVLLAAYTSDVVVRASQIKLI